MISTRLARSRCFRTDHEGRIPLRRDWPALFSTLRDLEAIALQSRHSYARLIHFGPPPEVVWDVAGGTGNDEAGTLRFRPDRWGAAFARLEMCECCDSPGHIEILNPHGGDILQLCPTVATPALAWAACLEKLAAPPAVARADGQLSGFPLLPDGLQPLPETSAVLPELLAALGREEIAVRFLLRTPEVAHLREFTPHRVAGEYPVMTATDGRTTLQLALPPAQGLALASDLSLHLAGPGNTALLSLAAGTGHAAAWRDVLPKILPGIRPLFFSR